jgi:hypothetical protein
MSWVRIPLDPLLYSSFYGSMSYSDAMKIENEDLQITNQSALELFYHGIKSKETKAKYTRTLRRILSDILENVLQGSFEDRASQLVSRSKTDPDWGMSMILALSKKLKERSELPKNDPSYLNPTTIPNYKPIKKLFKMNNVPLVWQRVAATEHILKFAGFQTEREVQFVFNDRTGDRFEIDVLAKDAIIEIFVECKDYNALKLSEKIMYTLKGQLDDYRKRSSKKVVGILTMTAIDDGRNSGIREPTCKVLEFTAKSIQGLCRGP